MSTQPHPAIPPEQPNQAGQPNQPGQQGQYGPPPQQPYYPQQHPQPGGYPYGQQYPQQPYAQGQYPPQQGQYPPQMDPQLRSQVPQPLPFDHTLVTSAFELPGYTVTRNFGLVRGIIVRSRSIVGQIGAGFQQLVGGNISLYTELCEQARRDAYEIMIQHAAQLGANGIIGARYDATEITQGVTEVLCYGTAVAVTPRQHAQE